MESLYFTRLQNILERNTNHNRQIEVTLLFDYVLHSPPPFAPMLTLAKESSILPLSQTIKPKPTTVLEISLPPASVAPISRTLYPQPIAPLIVSPAGRTRKKSKRNIETSFILSSSSSPNPFPINQQNRRLAPSSNASRTLR